MAKLVAANTYSTSYIIDVVWDGTLIVWLGLGQSLTLISLSTPTHPPPTHHTNFSGTSRLTGKLIFSIS